MSQLPVAVVQAGSYLFMDADYAANERPPPFRQSLFVLTTVMSVPRAGMAMRAR